MAADLAGRAMAGGGGVYASDDDPELVLAALPFGIKTMEGFIAASPANADLRAAAARATAAYAWLLQELEAAREPPGTPARRALDARAARLFARARDQALAGLEARHPGLREALRTDAAAALARADARDAELLYWAGAAWLGAISTDRRDLTRLVEMPAAAALVERVLAVDEGYDGGAAHEILIAYEAGRPGGSLEAAEAHYRRALELSGGNSAPAHIAYAEAVAVARQDPGAFRRALGQALAIDPDAVPERRLVTVIAQRRARRLLAEEPLLFVEGGEGAS